MREQKAVWACSAGFQKIGTACQIVHTVILTHRHSVKCLICHMHFFPEKYVLTNYQRIAVIIAHFLYKNFAWAKIYPDFWLRNPHIWKIWINSKYSKANGHATSNQRFFSYFSTAFLFIFAGPTFWRYFSMNLDAGHQILHF